MNILLLYVYDQVHDFKKKINSLLHASRGRRCSVPTIYVFINVGGLHICGLWFVRNFVYIEFLWAASIRKQNYIKGIYNIMALILSTRKVVSFLIICCSVIYNTYGRTDPSFRVKAVNLGGWLVTEGWIKSSLFDGIVNRDFMVSTVSHFCFILRI